MAGIWTNLNLVVNSPRNPFQAVMEFARETYRVVLGPQVTQKGLLATLEYTARQPRQDGSDLFDVEADTQQSFAATQDESLALVQAIHEVKSNLLARGGRGWSLQRVTGIEFKEVDLCPACQGKGELYDAGAGDSYQCDLCDGNSWVEMLACPICKKPTPEFGFSQEGTCGSVECDRQMNAWRDEQAAQADAFLAQEATALAEEDTVWTVAEPDPTAPEYQELDELPNF